MRIFFAERVSSGGVWKEIVFGIFISFLAHLIGLVLSEALRKYTYVPLSDAAEYAALGCIILTVSLFLSLRYSFFAATAIGVGAGIVVMASHQNNFWIATLVWALGLISIIRGFSEGSRLG